jgi:hypothetical protein
VKYTLFLADGTPIRANVSVQLGVPAELAPRMRAELAGSRRSGAVRRTAQTDWDFLRRPTSRIPLGTLTTSGAGLLYAGVPTVPSAERLKLVMWVTGALRGPATGMRWTIRIVENDVPRPRRWRVFGSFPVKWTGVDLPAQGNDVAMEELVLCHEGIRLDPD